MSMYTFLNRAFFCWIILFCSVYAPAQEVHQDTIDSDSIQFSNSLLALPLVFRTPETNWGFGAGLFYAFKPKHYSKNTRPSQIQLGGAYTLFDQILSYLPFQIFTNNNKFQFLGELGYYRFVYDYYGIGNHQPVDFRELFTVSFPRVRLQVMVNFRENQYVGIRYWMDDFSITETEPLGELSSDNILGSNGGFLSGVGLVHTFDTRDKIFDSHQGWLIETVIFHNGPVLGSDFDYSKFIVDARRYVPIGKNMALGINAYIELTGGNAPFNQLALMGGTRRIRGYYEGRFRDNHMMMCQGEFRFPIFWRFGGVIFGGLASVNDQLNFIESSIWRWSFGPGIRFAIDPKERINIRLDYGITKQSNGFYITVGEAF